MTWKAGARYFALAAMALGMAIVAGCGGGGGDTTEAPGLAQGRWGHSATLLEDGRLLVVGGNESPSRKLASAEIFDPGASSWSSAGDMAEPRGVGHTATLLADGRVLVTGDSDEAKAEVYDPSTGQWSSAGVMLVARNEASSTLLSDGMVLIAGGADATKAGRQELNTVELYNTSTGEWAEAASMAKVNSNHIATLMNDGNVMVVGQVLTEIYDPATDTWSSAGTPVRERSGGGTMTLLENGNLLVTGGDFKRPRGTGIANVPIRNAEIYDVPQGTWQAAEAMSETRSYHSAIALRDGSVLIIGSVEMELYNPGANTWTSAGSLTSERGIMHSATMLSDGRILVVGGREETDSGFRGISNVEIYDPATLTEG